MKVDKFNRKTVAGIAGIAVCALVFPAVASIKNPVTRPVKVSGNMLLVFTPSSPGSLFGNYTFMDWGQGAHVGRFSDAAEGTIDLGAAEFISGKGTIVAANGDEITWEVTATDDPTDTPNVVVYTGGTGRFQGASGGFAAEVTLVDMSDFSDDGRKLLQLTYVGRGEITY